MDLDETLQWGWGLKRLSLARFQRNRAMGFGDSAKNGSQRRCFFVTWTTHYFRHISWTINAKLSTNTCPGGVSRHMVSYSRKVSIKGSNFPKKTSFSGYFRIPCLCPAYGSRDGKRSATPTLFPSPRGHPTDLSFLGDFCWGMYRFQLSTSESFPLPQYQQWRNLDAYIFQTYSPGGATIGFGSPICSGILTTARFVVKHLGLSLTRMATCVCRNRSAIGGLKFHIDVPLS